eukprot:1000041-Rhodomonas_salina.1
MTLMMTKCSSIVQARVSGLNSLRLESYSGFFLTALTGKYPFRCSGVQRTDACPTLVLQNNLASRTVRYGSLEPHCTAVCVCRFWQKLRARYIEIRVAVQKSSKK